MNRSSGSPCNPVTSTYREVETTQAEPREEGLREDDIFYYEEDDRDRVAEHIELQNETLRSATLAAEGYDPCAGEDLEEGCPPDYQATGSLPSPVVFMRGYQNAMDGDGDGDGDEDKKNGDGGKDAGKTVSKAADQVATNDKGMNIGRGMAGSAAGCGGGWGARTFHYKRAIQLGGQGRHPDTCYSWPPRVAQCFFPQVQEFTGNCYRCEGPNHSQHYCWLQLCQRCGNYGHSARKCMQPEQETGFYAPPPASSPSTLAPDRGDDYPSNVQQGHPYPNTMLPKAPANPPVNATESTCQNALLQPSNTNVTNVQDISHGAGSHLRKEGSGGPEPEASRSGSPAGDALGDVMSGRLAEGDGRGTVVESTFTRGASSNVPGASSANPLASNEARQVAERGSSSSSDRNVRGGSDFRLPVGTQGPVLQEGVGYSRRGGTSSGNRGRPRQFFTGFGFRDPGRMEQPWR